MIVCNVKPNIQDKERMDEKETTNDNPGGSIYSIVKIDNEGNIKSDKGNIQV